MVGGATTIATISTSPVLFFRACAVFLRWHPFLFRAYFSFFCLLWLTFHVLDTGQLMYFCRGESGRLAGRNRAPRVPPRRSSSHPPSTPLPALRPHAARPPCHERPSFPPLTRSLFTCS